MVLCRLYVPFRAQGFFAYAFYPATVVSVILCSVVLGVPFFLEMSFAFFLKPSSYWFCSFTCSGVL